jgi:glycosyltransferase involved in cell wall biosynthesis
MFAEGKNEAEDTWDAARRVVGAGRLSIIMPAHNLGEVIAGNVRLVHRTFSGNIPFEIIVVDDGSTDRTAEALRLVAAGCDNVVAVVRRVNLGKGAALTRGFEACTGTHVLLLDGDLDLPPDQVPGFFDRMEECGADVVIGSKRHPRSRLNYPWHRKIVSNVYYGMVKAAFGLPVRDTQTGIKLFRREVLEYVIPRMLVKRFAFDLEMLAIAHLGGFGIADAPVSMDTRAVFGYIGPSTVHQVMNDTLAIFYRVHILRYYQTLRPMPAPGRTPPVSVVIAFPAVSACMEQCLSALHEQDPAPAEVILLPDRPTGRTWGGNVREIPTGAIRPAEKRNIGIGNATGEIVAFLDDDAYPIEGWMKKAIARFGDPATAAVGGPASTPPDDPWLAQLGGLVFANRLVSGPYRYRYVPERVRDVDDFPSCNLLVRTDALRKLGGFRTDFWPGEDTYLCMQIVHELGLKIVYDPWVHVLHHRRNLFLPHLRQVGRYALHRGHFARRFPATSRRASYMLPSLFAAGVIFGGIASVFVEPLRPIYLAALALYFVVVLLFGFQWEAFLSSFRVNPVSWLLVTAGIFATHMVYGVRFALGFFARALPRDVRHFDHQSETEKRT